MSLSDKIAARLSLIDGAHFSPEDRELIIAELEEFDRVLSELEEFARDTPWVAAQVQPSGKIA